MSRAGSDEMLGLLKELSFYKAMDEAYAAGTKAPGETEAYEERGRRRHEIKHEMQKLGTANKSGSS